MLSSFLLFFLIPYILSHFLQNLFSVAKSWGLASAVSSPPSGSEQSPAAKRIKCVLLCIIMFNGQLKQSLFNKSTT